MGVSCEITWFFLCILIVYLEVYCAFFDIYNITYQKLIKKYIYFGIEFIALISMVFTCLGMFCSSFSITLVVLSYVGVHILAIVLSCMFVAMHLFM